MANYWEKGDSNPTQTVRRVSGDEAAKANAQAILAKLAAMASGSSVEPSRSALSGDDAYDWGNDILFNEFKATHPEEVNNAPVQPGPTPNTSFIGEYKVAPPKSNNDGSGFLGGFQNSIMGLANSVRDMFGGPESIEDMYARLQAQYGGASYSGPSAEEMATSEFDPQFQMLKAIAKRQEERHQRAQGLVKQGYGALVNDAIEGRGANKKMSDQQVNQINTNAESAQSGISDTFNKSAQDNAKFLASLGILEGQDELMAKSNDAQARELGRLSQQQQVSSDLASQLGTNQYHADTEGIGITRQAGRNTADEFMQQFLDQQAGNDAQELALTGQRQKAENAYNMQIQELLQGGQQGIAETIQDQIETILRSRQQETENEFKRAGLDLDQARFGLDTEKFNAQQNNTGAQNAYDTLAQRAATNYGDANRARQVADSLLQVYLDNPAGNIADWMNNINPEQLNADPMLRSLAYDFFSRVASANQQR